MSKAVLWSAVGLAAAIGMVAIGYGAGSPEIASANAAEPEVTVAAAQTPIDRTEVETHHP